MALAVLRRRCQTTCIGIVAMRLFLSLVAISAVSFAVAYLVASLAISALIGVIEEAEND